MKKAVAIFLVILILFNVMGYYGVFLGLQYKNDQDLAQRFDNDTYLKQETITLKVPLSIPYHVDDVDYERVAGTIDHEGETYRLVKQKLSQDTLYIVCFRDHHDKAIKQAIRDYVKSFTDKPAGAKHSTKSEISFLKDFIATVMGIESTQQGWNYSISLISKNSILSAVSLSILSPPPRA
jgi:hypothetical protein